MKILSRVAVVLGVLVLLAGLGVLIWGSWTAYWHYATLSTGRSAEFVNPIPIIAGGAALLGVGGFLAGLGIGMPRNPKPVEPTGIRPDTPTDPTV
ncbi:MAG: hypothetical protein HZY73_13645 [Micropruina sp.]|nr:MAG: hypothetical protein HZY73_13645 [Micropruina sp.]